MTEDTTEKIRKIKQSLRLSMNGVISAHQRRQGLDYKINFGVEVPRIKSIAAQYSKDRELASALWQENIRESKMLAIFLLPEEEYSSIAEKWIAETPFTEIADHLVMNILCKLPTATEDAIKWIDNPNGLFAYCGYLTLSHLPHRGISLTPQQEESFYTHAANLFEKESNSYLRLCAINAINNYTDGEKEKVERLLQLAGRKSAIAPFVDAVAIDE